LLLIVAGMITIGILNAAYLSRASASCNRLWYPFKKNYKVKYKVTTVIIVDVAIIIIIVTSPKITSEQVFQNRAFSDISNICVDTIGTFLHSFPPIYLHFQNYSPMLMLTFSNN